MKYKLSITLLVFLFSLMISSTAGASQSQFQTSSTNFPAGTTIFVDVNNNSGLEDGSVSYPFNTIQEGIDLAVSGNVVGVAPGTYYENIILKAGVQLVGSDPATTIIDGGGSGTVVQLPNASLLQGFTVQHGVASFGAGIAASGSPIIRNNIIRNNAQTSGGSGAAIHGNNSSPMITGNLILENNADTQFLSGALSFINSSSPYIANNIIRNNTGRGAVNLTVPAGNTPVVLNNTIVDNVGAGIKVDMRVNQNLIRITNNIVTGNTTGMQMDFGTSANLPAIKYNNIFGNTTNFVGMTDITGVHGNLSLDPNFSNDFHLSYWSPMIDAGDPAEYSATDFEGDPRPMDGNGDGAELPDIGADERIFVDNVPPVITVTATKEDGSEYVAGTWTNQSVTVSFECLDQESGIASCPFDAVLSTDSITTEIVGVATDQAGNSAEVSFGPIKVDKTAPTLTVAVSPNPVVLNGTVTMVTSAVDELSGIKPGSMPCQNIDTSIVGSKSTQCWVMDNAGNQTNTVTQYQVIYDFEGFLSPVLDCVNNPCDPYNLSFFNAGSPISLKFRLKDANGNLVQAAGAPQWLAPMKIESSPPVTFPEGYEFPVSGSTYTWKKNVYVYDWSTKRLPAHTVWLVGVKLDDGETYYVFVALK